MRDTMSTPMLKLKALDQDDLAVISAHVQDSVVKPAEFVRDGKRQRFILVMNRFSWESAPRGRGVYERRRSTLRFDRVSKVRSRGIDTSQEGQVLSLLAIRFEETDAPAGTVNLVFAGGAEIQLEAECIEAELTDLGPAWETHFKPKHAVSSGRS